MPKNHSGPPPWYYLGGDHMSIAESNPGCGLLTLLSSSCRLEIRPHPSSPGHFILHWRVTISAIHEWNEGQRIFSANELKFAFDIAPQGDAEPESWEAHIRHEGRADAIVDGKFIRRGNYVNFPGPYSGLSVHLKPDIKAEIRKLLANVTPQ